MGDLRFQHNYSYSLDRKGIVVPVSLRSGALKTKVFAKLDIGAEVCLFERSVALDLDLEKGQPIWLETLTGNFLAYGHEITLTTIELSFVLTVYFRGKRRDHTQFVGQKLVATGASGSGGLRRPAIFERL